LATTCGGWRSFQPTDRAVRQSLFDIAIPDAAMSKFHPGRKKIFVSGEIQGRLMFKIAMYWLIYHVVLWHALFAYRYFEWRVEGTAPLTPFRQLYGEFVLQYYPMVICAVAMLPVFLIDLVRLTHRIAGPLVRFKGSLKRMCAGEPVSRVQLRKGDLLSDFETAFNEYVEHYERRRIGGEGFAAQMSAKDAEMIQRLVEQPSEEADAGAVPAEMVLKGAGAAECC
jgi:hypothetical protein